MKLRRSLLRVIIVFAIFSFFCPFGAIAAPKVKIKNVIVFIGDGMGNQQRRIAGIVEGRGNPNHRLLMEKFPVSGVAFNHCLDKIVTDSAASGTALACGHKTLYGKLSVDAKNNKLKTILELCKEMGKSTGLITTVTITHATPAAYGSHVPKRKMESKIAIQYLQNGIDVLLGGGRKYFLPKAGTGVVNKNTPKSQLGKRKDGRNMIWEYKKAGYKYVYDKKSLLSINPKKTNKLLGLFSRGAMAYEVDRNKVKEPSIEEMTNSAIKVLSKNPKGFFLMVEGGLIDWANHGHCVAGSVYDTIALDKAIKSAVKFARKNPQTLIIIVNDHETGGMAITANINIPAIRRLKATSLKMAYLIKNNPSKMGYIFQKYAGINNLTKKEKKMILDEVYGKKIKKKKWGYGGSVIANIISKRTGLYFSTGGHTGTPVIVAAYGPGSQIFTGFYDQTQIPKKIAKLLGISKDKF